MVNELLEEMIIGLEKYVDTDKGIKRLVEDAILAKNLPDLQKCCIAVLGAQGSGKSTLLTALLGRALVERSGKGASCTAVPTVIIHKKGAEDRTRLSDIKIEWISREQHLAHIQEHVQRWTEVFPGSRGGGADAEEEEENTEDEDAEASKPKSRKIPPTQTGAITAKEFFETIFNAKNDPVAKRELDHRLFETDIRQGDFDQLCLQKVQERFDNLKARLHIRDDVSEFFDVHDRDLPEIRSLVDKLWPFVKVQTIATGHMLLRYGICFFDLPGFGDTNQLRAAHINDFRWKANGEMIVADCSRIRTNIILERCLAQSIHLKGPQRTTLVTNKSDKLIDEDDFANQIRDIHEDPFPRLVESFTQLRSRLEELQARKQDEDDLRNEDDEQESDAILEESDALLKEGARAYVEYENHLTQDHMRDKNITIFSASAKSHLDWKNPLRREDPLLDPSSCGIVAIMRHLLGVPASTNLQNFKDHITKVLPAWRKQAGRVLQKHAEDKQYAKMRQDLAENIPRLKTQLEQTVDLRLPQLMVQPWGAGEEPGMHESIKELVKREWKHPKIFYNGFAKMLKENGIPVNGKYLGRNLNEEVLGPLEPAINTWAQTMEPKADTLLKCISQPVHDMLNVIQACVETCTAGPLLQEATAEALDDLRSKLEEVFDTGLDKLQSSLEENHLRHTTEMDIECPVAQVMRPSYQRAQDPQFVLTGKGIYERQRNVLRDSMLKPSKYYPRLPKEDRVKPLVESVKERMMVRQKQLWKEDCAKIIADVIEQLESFSRATEELLMNEDFMTETYKEARDVLRKLLFQFDRSLLEIQAEFDELETQHPAKKVKIEEAEESNPSEHPAEPMQQVPEPEAAEGNASVPINQGFGWHHFVANMFPLRPG
ncbi:hypothetical protein FB567DRAFT_528770, partial [Paraphoma chrysanthemicola]